MNSKTDMIEIDKAVADALRNRAAERGISVGKSLAEVVIESGPVTADDADMVELDRRWSKISSGQATVANDDVVRWLDTWGTPAFKPWRER